MNRISWLLKQMLPLTYRTHCKEGKKKVYWVWKMWFGRCYQIDKIYYTKGLRMTYNKNKNLVKATPMKGMK